MWRSVRIREDRYDEVAALARNEGRSIASMVDRLLVRGAAVPGGRDPEPSLASGVGAAVSAGLAVSSAPVASDGALAEREPTGSEKRSTLMTSPATDSGASTAPDAVLGVSPGPTIRVDEPGSRSASASPFVPDALKPKVDTTPAEVARSVPGVKMGGEFDLAKKQVTPHLKSEQAGRKK